MNKKTEQSDEQEDGDQNIASHNNTFVPVLTSRQERLCQKIEDFYQANSIQRSKTVREMFQGCMFLMRDECKKNPDRIVQAAHSLREILYNFPRKDTQKESKKEEIKKKIRILGSVKDTEEIRKKISDLYDKLSKIAHHKEYISYDDFQKIVVDFGNLLDILKTQLEVNREIDNILGGNVNESAFEMLKKLMDSGGNYFYVFNKASKNWVEIFDQKKYFNFNKLGSVRDEQGRILPEILYLKRMTEEAPSKVERIILSQEIPKDCSPELVEELFSICSQMPSKYVGTLVGKMLEDKWVEKILQKEFDPISLFYLQKMFEVLKEGKDYENMFLLFGSLIKAILNENSNLTLSNHYQFDCMLRIVFDDVQNIDIACKYSDFLIKLFSDITRENPDSFLHFSFWSRSDEYGLKYRILRGLLNEAIKCSKMIGDTSKVRALYSKRLNASIVDSVLFFRFSFFILALHKEIFTEEIKEMLLSITREEGHDFFSSDGSIADFEFMIAKYFDLFSIDEQDGYIDSMIEILSQKKENASDDKWIGAGSRLFSLLEKYHGLTDEQRARIEGEGFSLQEVELWNSWPVGEMRFSTRPINEKSPVSFKDYTIPEIIEKLQKELHPESMKADKCQGLSEERNSGGDIDRNSPRGVGDELKMDIARRFTVYVRHAEKFFNREKMPAFYTHAFLLGCLSFITKNEEKVPDGDLLSILNLCEVITKSGKEKEFIEGKPSGWDDEINHYWNEVHREMCSALDEIIRRCSKDFFQENRSSIFDITQYLLSHKQPTTKDESPGTAIIGSGVKGYTVASPLTIAINTVRGTALRTFISFMRKDHFVLGIVSDDVKEVFEKLLEKEETKSIWFLLGHYVMFFYDRDQEWAVTLLPKIFPKEKKDFYLVAWEGYLLQTISKKIFFDAYLQSMYKENIKTEKVAREMEYMIDPADRLGQHMAAAFIHFPEFDLGHDLFKSFFRDADNLAKISFVRFIDYNFIQSDNFNTHTNKEKISEKIKNLWGYLIGNESDEVLCEMDSWMMQKNAIFAPKFLADKILHTLIKTNGKMKNYPYFMRDALPKLVRDFPQTVFQIMELYLLSDESKIYYLDDDLFGVFEFLQESIGQMEFRGLVSNLLKKNPQLFSRLNDLKSWEK